MVAEDVVEGSCLGTRAGSPLRSDHLVRVLVVLSEDGTSSDR
jgi:hypothetical protein